MGMSTATRWKVLIVLAVSMEYFLMIGPLHNYSVFFVHFQDEFKTNAVLTGWLGSLASALLFLSSLIIAVLGSKIGGLRLVVFGTILSSAGYVFSSFISSLEYGYVTYGLMVGLGDGIATCAAGSLLLDWFLGQEDTCRATGAITVGASVGYAVCGPLFTVLTASYGWRNCFRIVGGMTLLLGLTFALPFLKSPDGPTEEKAKGKDLVNNQDKAGDGKELQYANTTRTGGASRASLHFLAEVLVNVEVWLWLWCTILAQLGWSFVTVNYSSFMKGLQLSAHEISVSLIVFGVAEMVGKGAFAVFGDRLPCLKLYVTVVCCIGGAVVSGFLVLCSTLQHTIVLSIAWGVCRGGIYGAALATPGELFAMYGSGVVMAVSSSGYGIGALLGAPITGALYDLTGDYTLSLFVLVATFSLSVLFALLIPIKRKVQSRWRCCLSTPQVRRTNEQTNDPEAACVPAEIHVRSVGTPNPAYEFENLQNYSC